MTPASPLDALRDEVVGAIPRALAMIDTDPTSPTLGVADRERWAWRSRDYANAGMQGLCNGLARAASLGIGDDLIDPETLFSYAELCIEGIARITHKDGSLDEILPGERSFCVTSLVAHDAMVALELMRDRLPGDRFERHLGTIEPLIRFTRRSEETHGEITNHLASALSALRRWARLRGETGRDDAADRLRDRLLALASPEGWFSEYGGADPGYQTRCLDYLVDAATIGDDDELLDACKRGVAFVREFAHPDGSFGGLYGGRFTRVYSPGGIATLAATDPNAAWLTSHMARGVADRRTVTLGAIDAGNLPALLSSYAMACQADGSALTDGPAPPPHARRVFPGAGLVVDRTESRTAVVSIGRGGVTTCVPADAPAWTDAGAVFIDARGRLASSQSVREGRLLEDLPAENAVSPVTLRIETPIRLVTSPAPTPFKFVVLRILSMTVFRWAPTRDTVKNALVRLLIDKSPTQVGTLVRTITLGEAVTIKDEVRGLSGFARIDAPGHCPFHMASRGYWQRGDTPPAVGPDAGSAG